MFPCNQFGSQEPKCDSDINDFSIGKGVVGGHLFTKADVNGANTRPTYVVVKEALALGDISWNFAGSFIVDKTGNIHRAGMGADVEETIDRLVSA